MPLKIHVYTICKNEEPFVERWVKACAGADGLHVLDTGSTDKCVEKLRALGVNVKVQEFKPWRFDVPRNVNLEMIPEDADICLQVDMDEILVPGWREVIEASWKPGTSHLSYYFAWSMQNGTPNHVLLYDKCHSRHNYEWRKPVHEIICPKKGFTEAHSQCEKILVHHYPDSSKPRSQYLPLLKLACEEEPEDQRNWIYYGRELGFHGDHQMAIDACKRYLASPNSTWGFERSFACIIIARCYGHLKNDLQKEMWLLKACGEEPSQREPWVELADHYRLTGNHLAGYVASLRALTIPKSWFYYCSEPDAYREKAHDIAAVTGWYADHKADAMRYAWEALRINPLDERLIENYDICRDLMPKVQCAQTHTIDVIILAWSKNEKQYQMCRRGIKNLRRSSPSVDFNIIVVESNQNLHLEPFVDRILWNDSSVTTIIPKEKFGYNRFLNIAFNDILKHSKSQYVMILNNDVILFSDGFGEKMIEACQQYSSVCPDGLREAKWGRLAPGKTFYPGYDLSVVNGWCIMFDRTILNAVSFSEFFPEEIAFHNQDCYYADMLKHRGFRHALTMDAQALHLQAQSVSVLSDSERRVFTVGQQLVYDRLVAKNILKIPFHEPKVYDCFTFFNELDTLEIRLETLDAVVDRFVLVEARQTHAGKDKPLYFELNKERFARFLHKIEHVVVNEFPDTECRWVRENFQRNAIMRGLNDLHDRDFVLISDADEIPQPARISERQIGSYKQAMYDYFYNVLNTCEDWTGTVATTGQVLKALQPQDMRNGRHHSTRVQNGGWHFSWIGDADHLKEKLHAFAHSEFDKPEVEAQLADRIERLVDFAGRDRKPFQIVPVDETFPEFLRKNKLRFALQIKPINE